MNEFSKHLVSRFVNPDQKQIGLKELANNILHIVKISEDYAHDQIQMEKELNNFYYTKSEELDHLFSYLYSAEHSMMPPNIFDEYFLPIEDGNIGGGEWRTCDEEHTRSLQDAFKDMQDEFEIMNNNFDEIARLNLKKIPSLIGKSKKQGIEKGPLKEIIQQVKQKALMEYNQARNKYLIKSKNVQIERPSFPNNLKWEQISIRFINGDDVQITAGELIYSSSAVLMGFQNGRNKKPTKQWDLLKILSLREGFLDWNNNQKLDKKTRDNIKKQKQELSDKLMEYFNIQNSSPFLDYKKEKGYKIKIVLIPEHSTLQSALLLGDEEDTYDEGLDSEDYINE